MDVYIKVKIITNDSVQKDLLIGLLSQAGYEGFEDEGAALSAFITEGGLNEYDLQQILLPLQLSFSIEHLAPVNWNEQWEKGFEPVIVGDFCCIRASFHGAVKTVKHDIIITPRMSFGTGHHATTFLMIEQMKGLAFDGLKVLDFGTGTGVLAILAEKLGSAFILAIDNDEWSIENATVNVAENGCKNIIIAEGSTIQTEQQFDVILANINRNVLLGQMESLAQHLAAKGVLLISGLLTGDRRKIEEKAVASGLRVEDIGEREGWIVLRLKVS
jgi:ribosomal protein L11 methyltransferase